MSRIIIVILFVLLFDVVFINCGKRADKSAQDEAISTDSIVTEPIENELQPVRAGHTDSVWFADYVTEPKPNPYPDILTMDNPEFARQWENYYHHEVPYIQKFSDTVVGKYSIRTYLINDSLEFTYPSDIKKEQYYYYSTPKGVMVIDDSEKNHTDSIIIYRKYIEDFLNEDLCWTTILGFDFVEMRNDTLVFDGWWHYLDGDWGPYMHLKFYKGELTLEDIYIPLGDEDEW